MFPIRRRFWSVGALAVVGVIAALSIALAASAAGSGDSPSTAATWTSKTPASSISATVYVSAVDCRHVARGKYAGEQSGVELLGSYKSSVGTVGTADFAGYYSYCHGHKPSYSAEFITSNPTSGAFTFTRARVGTRRSPLTVSPGDPLELSISKTATGLMLRITDVNTAKTATIDAPSLGTARGWAAGTMPIYAKKTSAPCLTGSVPIVDEYTASERPITMPGPTLFPPVVFDDLRVDGHAPRRGIHGVHSSRWTGLSGKSVVRDTNLSRGNFTTTRAVVRKPVLGASVDVAHVSGKLLIKVPGKHSFESLTSVSQIPNNSYIDAHHGHVQVTLGLPHGKSETGIFFGGSFKLHQSHNGHTTAQLAGSSFADCPTVYLKSKGQAHVAAAHAARKKKKKKKKKKGLWTNAHGDFSTQGSSGAAAALGTEWYTEDECGGTYFKVVRDKITVTAYYPRRHTVIVTDGHSYFAPGPGPSDIHLAPAPVSGGRYNVTISGYYDLTLVSASRPDYVDAAVAPQLPSGGDTPFYRDGSVAGVPRWRIYFHITPNLGSFQNWNVGVRIAGRLYVIRLRVH